MLILLLLATRINGALLSVQSGSMAPLIHKGDAVIVRNHPPALGEIITYQHNGTQITHRLVGYGAGGTVFTRGDNNAVIDPPVSAADIQGVVWAIVPHAGIIIDALHKPLMLILGVYLPASIVFISELRRTLRRYSQPTYRLPLRA